jgi:hypothetical protein
MSDYYYCGNCGDGPNNIKLNPYCPVCYVCVVRNNASQSSLHDDSTGAHTVQAHSCPQTTRSTSRFTDITRAQGNHAPDDTTDSFRVPSYLALPTGDSPYSQRPERPPVYRWQCCNCGADNSCKTDQGCATCCDHWRNACCHVYDTNNPGR